MITPQDVIDYTNFESVKTRAVEKLTWDLVQAKQDIFRYVGHKFDDVTKYATLPDEVKLAFIKVTEFYALRNSDESITKGFVSEKIGDYSYQLSQDGSKATSTTFSLDSLLSDHVQEAGKSGMRFKVRSL